MSEHVHPGLVEHAWIDKSFHALFEALDQPGASEGAARFQALADVLRAHIGGEELDIAKFADAEPEEAKTLLHDHAGFRAMLDELAAQSKAGSLSKSDVHALKLRVSLHEAREETGLYRWVKAR